MPVLGEVYDAYSLRLGRDPLTGEPLTDVDRLIIAGGLGLSLLSLGIGDVITDIGQAVRRLSRVDWSAAVRAGRGLGSIDNIVDLGRRVDNSLLRQLPNIRLSSNLDQVDDVAGLAAINNRLSGLDEFTGGNRAVQQGADLRHSLASSSSSGTLSQRLNKVEDICGNSFTAGTPVQTEEGQKPIEEIEIGDKVLAADPETGEQGYFEVVALTNHPTNKILRVTIDSGDENRDSEKQQLNSAAEVMEITPDHPVYVEGKGWVWAENLAIGDRLRRSDGGWAKVLAVERVKLAKPEIVYNFTVKGPHTYFVLEIGVLVHNAGVTQCDFNLGSERWHATENVTINDNVYKKGQFIPATEVHPPVRAGIPAGVEEEIMKNLPPGHVVVLRDRPLGAASLEGTLEAKRGWVKDWMILKKKDAGVRELIDARKVVRGEYEHVTLAYKWDLVKGQWEQGYNFKLNPKDPPVFVPSEYFKKYMPDERLPDFGHDNVTAPKLFGQNVLSDMDIAVYANRFGNIPDDILQLKGGFADKLNRSRLGGRLVEPQFPVSHGAQINIPAHVKAEMQKVPGRIEKIEAENVLVFANLPDIGIFGFVEVIPFKKAVKKYGQPWDWYPQVR